ncbi:hypothetical protein BDP27DRAFT_1315922 [Rhodocollybia butyracea]|uniref:Uncharacterized protein n=1 Tax=Rhodocollybia butyracea TaxID=206335 RepID=A0A9P5UDN0_9AGAR|nr:hypothetical protein BDP27DRAFT_1315922 [Rhodocollybia butyracea]
MLILNDPRKYAVISLVDSNSGLFSIFNLVNVCLDTLMTLLIAGRVWWLSREIRRTRYNFKYISWYSRTLAVVTESGVIYPLFIIILLSFSAPNWSCLGTIVSVSDLEPSP